MWQIDTAERWLLSPEGARIRLSSAPLFSLVLLLAYRRREASTEAGWVSISEIARLPGWRDHARESIGKEIQRYIRSDVPYPVEYERLTRGRYRFAALPSAIAIDADDREIERLLELAPPLEPKPGDSESAHSQKVMSFVQALARLEGTRGMGWSRSEFTDAVSALEHVARDEQMPPLLRFLGLDRILDLRLYSSHPEGFVSTLKQAAGLCGLDPDPDAQAWATARLMLHRVRLGLRQGRLEEASEDLRPITAGLLRSGSLPDSRTLADLYNSEGLARSRLSKGNREEALRGLGLLYRALEIRLLALQMEEVHASCLNVGSCLANDLGEIEPGLRWMAVADTLRETCGVAADSGLPDFLVVSMIRRFPASEPLKSHQVKELLSEIGMMQDGGDVEQYAEERLESGLRRSRDFGDLRGLMMGYRTRGYLRWLQGRRKDAFADALRFVHTARQLGEDLAQYREKLALQEWEQPLQGLYDFAWGLRLKSRSVSDVPPEDLAGYLEEYDEWVRTMLPSAGL